jgi:hypothetical protein
MAPDMLALRDRERHAQGLQPRDHRLLAAGKPLSERDCRALDEYQRALSVIEGLA